VIGREAMIVRNAAIARYPAHCQFREFPGRIKIISPAYTVDVQELED
jgi:hypothetical protein